MIYDLLDVERAWRERGVDACEICGTPFGDIGGGVYREDGNPANVLFICRECHVDHYDAHSTPIAEGCSLVLQVIKGGKTS